MVSSSCSTTIEGVAQVPQVLESVQQQVVVPLVQTDRRLVQDIEHPHQRGADLGGQADALALPAGQGARLAAEGEVLQAHRPQKSQPGADLLQNLVGDHHLRFAQGNGIQEGQGLVHRLFTEVVDGDVSHGDRQSLPLQAFAVAVRTRALAHAVLNLPLHGVRLGLPVAALQVVDDALKGLVQGALAPGLVVVQLQLLPLGAIQDDVQHLRGEFLHRIGRA